MTKWLLTFVIASVVLSVLVPRLKRFGIGRLPGDINIKLRGTDYTFPFGTVALFALLFWLIGRFI
jgi:hypothetical protein